MFIKTTQLAAVVAGNTPQRPHHYRTPMFIKTTQLAAVVAARRAGACRSSALEAPRNPQRAGRTTFESKQTGKTEP
jgi:hypothetical protein